VKSFNPGFLEKQPITQNLLQTIRGIAEYKGKQEKSFVSSLEETQSGKKHDHDIVNMIMKPYYDHL